MKKDNYDIPLSVVQGLDAVRKSGKYNMFSAQNVFNELHELGYHEAVCWLYNDNWKEGSYKSQVDTKKYAAALKELGEYLNMTNILTE